MKTRILIILFLVSTVAYSQRNTNSGTDAGNSGSDNTSIGYNANNVVTGIGNTSIGSYSGRSLTSGNLNVFSGYRSGYNTTSGGANIFFGALSGEDNTTGGNNTFVGHSSGNSNTTTSNNSYFGYLSGFASTGSSNTYIGTSACQNCTTGSNNVVVGRGAGAYANSGSNNVFLGYRAGYNGAFGTAGSSNIFIGYESGYNESGSNKLYIENSNAVTPLIYGDFATDKVGINSLPNTTHTLTVGGTIHSTGLFVNGVAVSGDMSLWNRTGVNVYTVSTADNIGIGTTLAQNPNSYKLAVNGKIGAKEVQIENTSLTWPDFVFKADYKLLTLPEVEAFIKANGHLPEIPSEEQVAKEGIKVSELNAKLLQKIEELTLYIIELKKEVDALKSSK